MLIKVILYSFCYHIFLSHIHNVELTYLDYAYHHLLQHMDNASRRYKKFNDAKKCGKSTSFKNDDGAQIQSSSLLKDDDVIQDQSSNEQIASSDLENYADYKAQAEYYKAQAEYYKAQFKNSVMKKGHANPTTDELNFVRDHMRQFNSSEHEFFSMLQNHLREHNAKFATRFNYMMNNDCDGIIDWIKDSLIPFGKQLLNWCDGVGDKSPDQNLYRCNGNHMYIIIISRNYLTFLM